MKSNLYIFTFFSLVIYQSCLRIHCQVQVHTSSWPFFGFFLLDLWFIRFGIWSLEKGVRLHSFTYGNPIVPKPFPGETILFLKGLFYALLLCVYDVLEYTCATTSTWRSEDNFPESVTAWDRTQVIGLLQQAPVHTEPSCWPWGDNSFFTGRLDILIKWTDSGHLASFLPLTLSHLAMFILWQYGTVFISADS